MKTNQKTRSYCCCSRSKTAILYFRTGH